MNVRTVTEITLENLTKRNRQKTQKRHDSPLCTIEESRERPMIPPRRLGRVQCKTEKYFRPQAVSCSHGLWRGLEAVLFQPVASRKRQREKILQAELSCRVIPRSRKVGTQGAGSHARQKRRTRRGRWRPPKSLTGWSVSLDSPKLTDGTLLLIKFGSNESPLYFTVQFSIQYLTRYRFPRRSKSTRLARQVFLFSRFLAAIRQGFRVFHRMK